MPILLVDVEGKLIFYNEPAELILGQRFEETGEIARDTWGTLFAVADEERNPIAPEDRPTMLALSEHLEAVTSRRGPSPWLVAGAAFAAGYVLAKTIDWRGHAHPRR